MTGVPTGALATVVDILMVLLTAAMGLAFVRLVRGPSLPDRVVALDLIATLVVGTIAVYSIRTGRPLLIRPAIVVALITFLATVAFAYYIEKRGKP